MLPLLSGDITLNIYDGIELLRSFMVAPNSQVVVELEQPPHELTVQCEGGTLIRLTSVNIAHGKFRAFGILPIMAQKGEGLYV